jgi:hypothetical protein
MEENLIILVLNKILPEFPDLAGEQWDALAEPLGTLLTELDEEQDPQQRDFVCYQVLQLLKTVPVLIQRFDQEMDLFDPSQGPQVTKGGLTTLVKNFWGRRKTSNSAITRFVDISCPRKVWIESRRISVVVRLNEAHPENSDVPRQELLLVEERPVLVRIEAPDFMLQGPDEQELILSSEPISAPLVFDLAPRRVGFSSIHFDFIQDGNYLGAIELPLEITALEVSVQAQEPVVASLQTTGRGDPADFTLYITCVPTADPRELHFRLMQKGQSIGQDFPPLRLDSSLQAYTRNIYLRLTALMERRDPVAEAVLGSEMMVSKRTIEDRLREEGMNLWKYLIPLELQLRYESERAEWANRSLLIISDEPDVPWELLWPEGDEHPLCLQMNLARWLKRSSQERTIYEPKHQLSLQRIGVIAPPDMGLVSAQKEHMFLRTFLHQYLFQDVSPLPPTYTNVKRFLQTGAYDWIHIATHGNFYPVDPEGESAIWLQDQQPLTPHSIIGEVAQAIRQQRPAFVLNACEVGRQSRAINGLGGWASRLIGAGAGLFLAPLWPVDDDSAYRFTRSLYQSFSNGATIAAAVRQGRLDAKRAGDPTWLAYSLYAHPNATLG